MMFVMRATDITGRTISERYPRNATKSPSEIDPARTRALP